MPAKSAPAPQPYTILLRACDCFAALGAVTAVEPGTPAAGQHVFAGESPPPGGFTPSTSTEGRPT